MKTDTPKSRALQIARIAGGAAIVAGLAGVALPQLLYPLGFDQAVYAACGDVIRRGGVPIKDCFETKQMGVMVMYALAMRMSPSAPAIHAFTLIWTAATSVFAAWLTGRMFAPGATTLAARLRAGAWAGALYWLMYAGINYWSMDQAETYTNLLIGLAWAGVALGPLSSRRSAAALLAAGSAIGAAIWFKYVFALIGAGLGVVLLWRALRESAGDSRARIAAAVRCGALFAAGAVAFSAAVLAYYAAMDGLPALGDQFQMLRDLFPLAPPRPWQEVVAMLLRFADNGADLTARYKATLPAREYILLGAGFPLILGLASAGTLLGLRRSPGAALAGLAVFVTSAAVVVWQGNYIQYHYTLLMLPLAVFAGAALTAPAGQPWAGMRLARVGGRVLGLATLALLAWRMAPVMADAWQNAIVAQKPLREIYLESYQGPHILAAEQLAAATQPSDQISIIGDAPWVYTLAGRANATRFSFVNLWLKRAGTASHDNFVAQFAADLARNKPAYVVLTKAGFPWAGVDYLPDYKSATALYTYVEANYQYEGENGPFLLFRRK